MGKTPAPNPPAAMPSYTAQISNPTIRIKPSKKLVDYIRNIKSVEPNIPTGIKNIMFKNKPAENSAVKACKAKYFTTEEDRTFIESLELNSKTKINNLNVKTSSTISEKDKLLCLRDLYWLYDYINASPGDTKVYLHDLLENSEIILPENQQIARSAELEKRCQRLKAAQENKLYNSMTKNVDSMRRKLPEDTLSYQLQQINRHLIVIFQFIVTVAAGFAFGFIGVELIIGNLDFGFRLLLGIVCALVIALAELYFLAKRLNEDLELEFYVNRANQKIVKTD